jgi:hypothetical protein
MIRHYKFFEKKNITLQNITCWLALENCSSQMKTKRLVSNPEVPVRYIAESCKPNENKNDMEGVIFGREVEFI